MEQSSRDQKIMIDDRIFPCHKLTKLRYGKRVLEQPSHKGMMYSLGGTVLLKLLNDRFILNKEALRKGIEMRLGNRVYHLQKPLVHLIHIFLRNGHIIRHIVLALGRYSRASHIYLQRVVEKCYLSLNLDIVQILKMLYGRG